MEEKQIAEKFEQGLIEQKIWKDLAGKRIVFAGLNNSQRQTFAENMGHICSQNAAEITISEQFETIGADDLVLLFGQMDTEKKEIGLLMDQIKELAVRKPASAVLVSDCRVYGKQYGSRRSLKEDELGYVSHTKEEELPLHYMRMMEHLACRLAREEDLPIKVVRQSEQAEQKDLRQMLEAVLTVLQYGENGEIYNLLCTEEEKNETEQGEAEEHSPLSPMPIIPDTQKIKQLMEK